MAAQESIPCDELVSLVNEETAKVKEKIRALKGQGDQISISDMFEMQMLMNRLSQLSEMSTQVVSASNQAIMSVARNVKH